MVESIAPRFPGAVGLTGEWLRQPGVSAFSGAALELDALEGEQALRVVSGEKVLGLPLIEARHLSDLIPCQPFVPERVRGVGFEQVAREIFGTAIKRASSSGTWTVTCRSVSSKHCLNVRRCGLEHALGLSIGQGRGFALIGAFSRAFHTVDGVRLDGVLVGEEVEEFREG